MKKISFFTVAVMTASIIFSSAVHAADISIVINGSKIETETPAVISDDRTLVPLRAISEALGCDVAWDSDTKGITLTDGDSLYFTWIGRDYAFKTSSVALEDAIFMDAPPVIMNDFTMVPLRAISELFGANVDWDGNTYTVTVNYATRDVEEGLAEKFNSYEKSMNNKYEAYKGYVDGTANTVNAEIQLENFYDGLIFHRVIKDFMIQGGGFDTNLTQKNTDSIAGEFIINGYFNLIPHERGVISMARTTVPDSASSQFFIMHADTASLNGQYAAFGKVTSGMEYVDAIANTETQTVDAFGDDVPVENQVIKTVVIK